MADPVEGEERNSEGPPGELAEVPEHSPPRSKGIYLFKGADQCPSCPLRSLSRERQVGRTLF